MRYLVLDDDPDFADGLVDLLSLQGLEAVGCTRVDDALEQVRRGGFDKVFLDVKMPGRHGIEVALAVREIDPELPVVMMTGFTMEQLVQFILERPATVCWDEGREPRNLDTMIREQVVLALSPDPGFAERAGETLRNAGWGTRLIRQTDTLPEIGDTPEHTALVMDLEAPLARTLEVCWQHSALRKAPRLVLVAHLTTPHPKEMNVKEQLLATGVLFKPFDPETFWDVARGNS